MKLNLGCDDLKEDGYLGVDLYPERSNGACDVAANCLALPFADESIEEIYASHLLEHLEWDEDPMEEWSRVLQPGGTITVAFPDLFEVMLRMYEGSVSRYWYNCSVFGGHKIRGDLYANLDAPPDYFEHFRHDAHVHKQALTGPMVLQQMWPFFPDARMVNSCPVRERMVDVGETMIIGTKPEVEDG